MASLDLKIRGQARPAWRRLFISLLRVAMWCMNRALSVSNRLGRFKVGGREWERVEGYAWWRVQMGGPLGSLDLKGGKNESKTVVTEDVTEKEVEAFAAFVTRPRVSDAAVLETLQEVQSLLASKGGAALIAREKLAALERSLRGEDQ